MGVAGWRGGLWNLLRDSQKSSAEHRRDPQMCSDSGDTVYEY